MSCDSSTGRRPAIAAALIAIGAIAVVTADVRVNDCDVGAAGPSTTITVPGNPWGVVPDRGGCRIFVALAGGGRRETGAVAIVTRSGAGFEVTRVVPISQRAARGLALTHDERLLIVAADDDVVVLDVEKMTA